MHDADHFRMLREAKRRKLQAKPIGRGVFAVPSYSRRGRWHKVVIGVFGACTCEAITEWCTHRAAALDHLLLNSPSPSERIEYLDAQRRDFAQLELRILHGGETAEDRRYAKPHAERVAARYAVETPARDYTPTF
jgi:hypothetical protein